MINFYIDKALCICWLMNFICHDISADIMKIHIRKSKIIIFSFLLSLIGICSIFTDIFKLAFVFIYPLILLLMFGKCSLPELIRRFIICISSGMLFGAVFLTVLPSETLTSVNINGRNLFTVNDIVFFCALGCVYFGVKTIFYFLINKKRIYKVRIKIKDSFCETEAMIDTGNSLRVPLSGEPVIIAERSLFSGIETEDGTIRCKTVCGEGNNLKIFQVDDLFLTEENIHFSNIYAALVDTPLNKEGNYQVLLHNSFLSR